MRVFRVTAEPVDPAERHAAALVVAEDPHEAVLLLRKDLNFTGYRLPPLELIALEPTRDQVRSALGDAAAQEKGVYNFALVARPDTPPR
ncbi:MAG: hypothetical protein JO305_09900 [Alphaproteobacteria bacterium]|nr:hypothetical protein [Alphaproteobacteria bacterium]